MAGQEIFLEYRSEFHDLFVDVEDEIAALVEQLEPGFAASSPGPDVITALRRAFAEANYDHGPVRPVSLVRAVCREESIERLVRECGASHADLMSELGALEDETVVVFRGWLPRLFRQYWNRQRWTRELALLLAHAAIEGALRHRSSFTCADVLLSVW